MTTQEKIEQSIKSLIEQCQFKVDIQENREQLLNSLSGQIKSSHDLSLLKEGVLDFISKNPNLGNSEIARRLNILSHDKNGGNKDWFSWKILQLLLKEGKIIKDSRKKYQFLKIFSLFSIQ